VTIRVMSGKRDLVACEPVSGWAFRCAFDVQIGDVVLVSGDGGPSRSCYRNNPIRAVQCGFVMAAVVRRVLGSIRPEGQVRHPTRVPPQDPLRRGRLLVCRGLFPFHSETRHDRRQSRRFYSVHAVASKYAPYLHKCLIVVIYVLSLSAIRPWAPSSLHRNGVNRRGRRPWARPRYLNLRKTADHSHCAHWHLMN
jgi:hypothetical protein